LTIIVLHWRLADLELGPEDDRIRIAHGLVTSTERTHTVDAVPLKLSPCSIRDFRLNI